MAFDIIGPKTLLSQDGPDYHFFEFIDRLQEDLPQLRNVTADFYGKAIIHTQQVVSLKKELQLVKERYTAQIRPQIIKTRKVYAKYPKIFSEILERLLLKDRLYAYILTFIEICDEAIATEGDIHCVGD